MKIGDLIEVPPVRTVIRLEEGRIKAEEIAASFVFTPEVFSHLTVIAEALITSNGQGYFLQGDFGSGKSHFLAALYAWLAAKEGRQVLAARHGGLKRAGEMEGRFLPVDISLINYRAADSLEKIILEMTEYSLRQHLPPGDGNKIELTPAPKRSDTFLRLVETVRSAGFTGVVLLIDELSEFFRSKASPQALNEDARTLQLLGELSTGQPLWIVAAVQESVEQTGDIALSILRKIRDRFPVKLTLSTTHIRSLISGRLVRYKPGAEKEIYRIYEEYRRQFPAFSVPLETFRSSYPVHPVTLSLLEGLGALFSQHRGLVDFVYSRIAGDTRRDIPSILDRPANELLAPDSIYEHFAGRLAEFSDFNIYPRHIVPHLDKVIDSTLELEEDRTLARRLVRMLVLYHIHPTASEPSVSELAELSACSLDFQSADLSSRFVAETVLEPVASAGRFLARVQGELDNPGQAVYAIVSEDDPSKTMEARLRRVAEEIDPEDSRLLLEAFVHLRESESWPGKALLGEGLRRSITWSSSIRQVLVRFVHRNEEPAVADRLAQRLETEGIDCIVLLVLGQGAPDLEHTAVWQIPNPEDAQVLKEFLACALTLEELNVSNPAEAPLIPLVQERTQQLAPAACQAALEAIYAGRFADSRIRIDPAVLQLKHFGRLLEAAGETLLENRYPRFREVAPRRFNPSPRIYNQLLEEFIIPGALTLSEARARALSAALDGLAVPLGLVEIRRGSYLFSPDTVGYPLLSFFFGCLSPSGDTAMEEILNRLERGLFGLPRDTALFLIASLAAGGLITVRRSGRALPLEYLNLNTMEKAEAVSLGELISERDQTTLKQECAFLAPAGGWESFGLRQQRETWKETLKLKDTGDRSIEDIRCKLARMEGFSSFQAFDVPAFHRTLERLGGSLQQIKVSYGAKEGLERFLSAWRGSGLTDKDVELLKRLNKFLSQSAEEFIFINRYLNHPVVEKAAALDSSLDGLRQALLKLLSNPEDKVVEDSGAHLAEVFGQFRDQYVLLYARQHDAYYRAFRRRPLSKNAVRALEVLSRLAVIEALDRPPGLEQYLGLLNAPNVQQCSRNLPEELIRSPVCMCGFKLGDVEEKKATDQDRNDPEKVEQAVDRFLQDYVSILQNPDIMESVTVQAYALKDAEPETAASLEKIIQALKSGALNAPTLVNLIDGAAAGELDRALKGRLPIRKRDLSDLERTLAGRRLPPALVLKLVNEWLAGDEEPLDGAIIAVERSAPAPSAKAAELDWWSLLHENAAYGTLPNTGTAAAAVVETAAALKKLEERLQERFPSVELRENFSQMQPGALFRLIAREPFHFQAAREAWRVLTESILNGAHLAPEADMKSGSASAERAATVENALRLMQTIASGLTQSFPRRLALRLPLSRILTHPWATAELRSAAGKTLEETSALGEEWLSGLSPVAPIDLEIKPLVLVFDGASPDLWLEISDTLASFRPNNQPLQEEWARLEAVPETVDALIGLFGLEADPEESFYQRQVVYANLSGDEEHGLKNYLQSLPPDKAIVLRLKHVDRGAHSGKLHLTDMYEVMKNIIESELKGLLELCKKQKRDLVLTADHGLTLKDGRLTHGQGGPYERAIYRARFFPTDA